MHLHISDISERLDSIETDIPTLEAMKLPNPPSISRIIGPLFASWARPFLHCELTEPPASKGTFKIIILSAVTSCLERLVLPCQK